MPLNRSCAAPTLRHLHQFQTPIALIGIGAGTLITRVRSRIHKIKMFEFEKVKDGKIDFKSSVDRLQDKNCNKEAHTLRDYVQHEESATTVKLRMEDVVMGATS